MKRTGPMRVLGLWISPLGDRAEGALVRTDGTTCDVLEEAVLPLDNDTRSALGTGGRSAATATEDVSARLFEGFEDVELIGFQGPVLRFEQGQALEEAGRGDVLSAAFGVPVAWDFLNQDFQLGGHSTLMGSARLAECVAGEDEVVLLTLDARAQAVWAKDGGVVSAQETGPGVGLLTLAPEGQGGKLADHALEELVVDPFYTRMGPRSVPVALNDRAALTLEDLTAKDARATASALIVAGVVQTLADGPFDPARIILAGPGAEDHQLVAMLRAAFGTTLISACPFDAPQAVGTALIAAALVRSRTVSGPQITGVPTAMAAGTLSKPPA